MSRKQKKTVVSSVLMIVMILWVSPLVSAGQFADSPQQDQVRINCGSVSGFMQEQYLYAQSGSTAQTEYYPGTGKRVTKRWADKTSWFTYRIPISPSTTAPVYLSMVTKGEVKLKVDGTVVLNTGNSGEGSYTPREVTLTNSSLWSDGYIEVRFEDADTSDGWGPNAYWLECGKTSVWRERARHILWDTSGVVWQTGYYDGTGNEFKGTVTNFTVGGDIATLAKTGTLSINWSQTVTPGKKYFLLTGIIGGTGNNNYIDMKNDGSNEIARAANRERVYDLDVTAQVLSTGNVVKIQMASGATLDFISLVEVTDGYVTDNDLRVTFKGNEMARNWSRLANATMYWNNDYMTEKGTGFIDASLANGLFPFLYWIADAAPAMMEMARWGYYDLAKQATNFDTASGYYNADNGAAGLVCATMAYLIKADNFTGTYATSIWPKLGDILDYYCAKIDGNSYHLVEGNNWETTANGYGVYNNSLAYVALRTGAEVADAMGYSAQRNNWNNHADLLFAGINSNLLLSSNKTWLDQILPGGSWRFAMTTTGGDPTDCTAGWFGIGSHEEILYGYRGSPLLSAWRDATNVMLDYHSSNFWASWKAYGHNRGFGTSYGVLSERGGWPLLAMLMSDRMDMAKKNLNHVVWNSCDLNFANDNEGVQETSPWVLVREVDKDDDGIVGADVGNGGEVEDMNLVEYIVTLRNVRLMAGVDDTLSATNSLIVMPRIPRGWNGVKVASWPIRYRNGTNIGKTTVSYDYSIDPLQGSIAVSSASTVTGVQFRFGPFETDATISAVTVNGTPTTSYSMEDRGDSRWVWITESTGATTKNILVTVSHSDLRLYDNFNDGDLSGWTPNGGTWSNPGTTARVVSMGDAWNIHTATVDNAIVSAEVSIQSGNSAGISFRTNSSGSTGYDLILDAADGKMKLCKRPYEVLGSADIAIKSTRTYTLKAEAVGTNIKCFLDGVRVFEVNDDTYASGRIGMFSYNATATFDNCSAYGVAAPAQSVIFKDNFNDGDLAGWAFNGGTWYNTGTRAQVNSPGDAWAISSATGSNFTYYGNITLVSGNAVGLSFRTNANGSNGYDVIIDRIDGKIKLCRRPYVVLGSYGFTVNLNQTYSVMVAANNSNIKVYLDGVLRIDVNDSTYSSGGFGMFGYNSVAEVDDLLSSE